MPISRIKALRAAAPAQPWEAGESLPHDGDLVAEFVGTDDAGLAVEITNDAAKLIALYDAVKAYQPRMLIARAPLKAQRLAIDAALRALEP